MRNLGMFTGILSVIFTVFAIVIGFMTSDPIIGKAVIFTNTLFLGFGLFFLGRATPTAEKLIEDQYENDLSRKSIWDEFDNIQRRIDSEVEKLERQIDRNSESIYRNLDDINSELRDCASKKK